MNTARMVVCLLALALPLAGLAAETAPAAAYTASPVEPRVAATEPVQESWGRPLTGQDQAEAISELVALRANWPHDVSGMAAGYAKISTDDATVKFTQSRRYEGKFTSQFVGELSAERYEWTGRDPNLEAARFRTGKTEISYIKASKGIRSSLNINHYTLPPIWLETAVPAQYTYAWLAQIPSEPDIATFWQEARSQHTQVFRDHDRLIILVHPNNIDTRLYIFNLSKLGALELFRELNSNTWETSFEMTWRMDRATPLPTHYKGRKLLFFLDKSWSKAEGDITFSDFKLGPVDESKMTIHSMKIQAGTIAEVVLDGPMKHFTYSEPALKRETGIDPLLPLTQIDK